MQNIYNDKASVPSSGHPFESSGDAFRISAACSGALALPLPNSASLPRQSRHAHQKASSPPKRSKTSAANQDPSSGTLAGRLDKHWTSGHDQLVQQSQHLLELYGDAGAMETLAAGIRILDTVGLGPWQSRVAVKAAVVMGMAAKLPQASTDVQHVRRLWAQIAGKSSDAEVRRLEKQVFATWARRGLSAALPARV